MNELKKYGQGEINELVKKLSPKNKKLLEKAEILFNATAGKGKSAEHRRSWIKIAYITQKDMNKHKPDDGLELAAIIKNSDSSKPAKNELKNTYKRWIRESGFYDTSKWQIVFKKAGAFKAESEVNKDKINSDTMVSPDEVKKLIQSTPDLMWKLAIQLNSLMALRAGCEMLTLRFEAVNFDKQTIKINSGKTGRPRTIFIGEAMQMVKRWYDEYKYPDVTKRDFIFPSPRDRNKSMNLENYDIFLKKLSMKVLGRPVNPYLLRHSTLKVMQKKLSQQVYTKFADHSLNIASKFYSHTEEQDLTDELRERIYKITPLSKEKKEEYEKQINNLSNMTELLIEDKLGKLSKEEFNRRLAKIYSNQTGKEVKII